MENFNTGNQHLRLDYKVAVERVVTVIQVHEVEFSRLGDFMDCQTDDLWSEFGEPTSEYYHDNRRIL